jgi:predicted outer membrane repeat protein
MKRIFFNPVTPVAALVGLLFAALWLMLAPARPARAAGIVTNCTGQGLADAMNGGSGFISFDCGPNPVVISITQAGGYNVVSSAYYTIDGGNKVTLTGRGGNRLFDVQAGGSLTLTNIILTDGYAFVGGNLPTMGGAILAQGDRLVLDHVTIRNSESDFAGGAVRVESGVAIIKDSLLEFNMSDYGGGVDSIGTLTVINTIIRYNHALVNNGGGLDVGGTVVISNSQFYSNTAGAANPTEGGGGLAIIGLSQVTISGSRFEANRVPTNKVAWGGAILNRGVLTMTQTVFEHNSGYLGGGLAVGGTAMLSSTVFNSNTASFEGGGIFISPSGVADLDHALLTDNHAVSGGGIYNFGGQLTMRGSTLFENMASALGGGICHEAFGGSIADSVIQANSAGTGGGIHVAANSSLTLERIKFTANSAASGAGLSLAPTGDAELFDSTFIGNKGTFGAGIYSEGFLTLDRSTLSGNTASSSGGGLLNINTADLTNSTLSGNTAGALGGGIYNIGSLTLKNVTLSNNSAATSGGALFMGGSATSSLTNTILAHSPSGGNCSGPITASKFSFSSDNSCGFTGTVNGHDPNGLDPLLTGLGNYGGLTPVHMLKLGSPAIAGVVGSDAPNVDQRSQPRPGADGNYDIGAVERHPADTSLAPRLYLPQLAR